MPSKKVSRPPKATGLTAQIVMCLYVAARAPNSVQALTNLEAICTEYLLGNFQLEVVDVLEQPLRALADGIVVTPSLAKLSPSPVVKVIGTLSDKLSVLRALGVPI